MATRTRSSKEKLETDTSLKSPQLSLPLAPVPTDAENKVMELLFALAMKGNVSAAKLFLDCCHADPDDEPAFTVEDAMKLLQEHFQKAA